MKLKKAIFLVVLIVCGSSLTGFAQTVQELKIKRRSTFNAPAGIRDPFWPVGWRKAAPVQANVAPAAVNAAPVEEFILKPEAFSVTSISTGGISLALINGKTYGEGDLIPVTIGAQRIGVQVVAIKDGVVTLRYQSKTANAYLKGLRQ